MKRWRKEIFPSAFFVVISDSSVMTGANARKIKLEISIQKRAKKDEGEASWKTN